jgi:hypothetical protein
MRRKYISPEFTYNVVNGTFNMLESSAFFGSKMLDIDDSISILNQNILYYQSSTKEQIDLTVETNNTPITYNTVVDKQTNQILSVDDSQSKFETNGNAKWIVNIQIGDILADYIFALIKQSRAFEGLRNTMTLYNDVDLALMDYVKKNVVNKYRFTTIDFFISYKSLKKQNVLRSQNNFNQLIESDSNLLKRIQTSLTYDEATLTVNFSQEQASTNYAFDYYYNLYFERI